MSFIYSHSTIMRQLVLNFKMPTSWHKIKLKSTKTIDRKHVWLISRSMVTGGS